MLATQFVTAVVALATSAHAIDAWLYSADSCEPWNETLSSGARNMESDTCNKGQAHNDPGDVGQRKQMWLPSVTVSYPEDKPKSAEDALDMEENYKDELAKWRFCLWMSTGPDCTTCMDNHMDISLANIDEGCTALPTKEVYDSFMFVKGTCDEYIKDNGCEAPPPAEQ